MTRVVGITLGEPCGIGPEVLVRTLASWRTPDLAVRIYGSPALLKRTARELSLESFVSAPPSWIEMVPCGPDPADGRFPEGDLEARAAATLAAIDLAHGEATQGRTSAIVTAPIDKSVVRSLRPGFTGHTGYLAELAGVPKTLMLMDNGEMTILLLTGHIPLRDIAATLTQELVESSIRLALSDLKSRFELKKPRIAVAGLNPHAGEIVTNSEESAVFTPVLDRLRGEGIDIEGPFAADSLFPMARGGRWDLIVSGYHDQGLIAAKYPGLDKVVNITLGLPYTRVSPGHGTAYDIAGLGRADPRSFERALKIAFSGRIRGL